MYAGKPGAARRKPVAGAQSFNEAGAMNAGKRFGLESRREIRV